MKRTIYDVLSLTEWGMEHFSGITTNRALPKRDMMRAVEAGLCRSIGSHPLCDGDGFTIYPERYREVYVLTDKGFDALEAKYAEMGETWALKRLREIRARVSEESKTANENCKTPV